MGCAEDTLAQNTRTRTGSTSWRNVAKVVFGTALALWILGMFGGQIDMVPWRPSKGSENKQGSVNKPLLMLREVYVQSSPKPPESLLTLSAQGTHAGKMALRAWFDDQAEQARARGYSFPFRLGRWQAPASAPDNANDRSDFAAAAEQSVFESYGISFAQNEPGAAILAENLSEAGVLAASQQGAAKVRATGTARLLDRLRSQYLSSRHGRRHSYWSATPARIDIKQDGNDGDEEEPPVPEPPARWNYYVEDGLRVPNITHKPTLVSLARMVANAYQPKDSDTWEQLGDRWDTHDSFGWATDGLRGHVFADAHNRTVVISLKGTSSTFFLGGGSETSARDKFNDNRLFSCCCAYVDFTWSTVCDCHVSGNKCNSTCLQEALSDESADNYFYAAAQIFMDVIKRYPEADIVLAGHSLGGAVAGLLGLTFGLPAVGFEAPGDRLASERLHLPQPPGAIQRRLPLFHIGNTADPVYMGMCSGRTSSCYYAGYAMESRCHNGRQLVFDTVQRRDWRLDIRHHRINEIIYLVIEPWGLLDPEEAFPELRFESKKCADCGLWNFVNETSPQNTPLKQ